MYPLLYRKLRERDATKYHIQLCIALFCMLIVFVSGIDRADESEPYAGCVVVSVLIHYFTMVAVMWMGAEAVLMFQKLVIVFVRITTKFIIAVSLVCWCKYLQAMHSQITTYGRGNGDLKLGCEMYIANWTPVTCISNS